MARQMKFRDQYGFTLFECVAVLLILSIVSLLVTRHISGLLTDARQAVVRNDLQTLRESLMGEDVSLLRDISPFPGFLPVNPLADHAEFECLNVRIHLLFCPTNFQSKTVLKRWNDANLSLPQEANVFDPDAQRGWRGPYVRGNMELASDRRFPGPKDRRNATDATFFERGFYLKNSKESGSSPYGFVGEYALFDPWGNPYIVQIPEKTAFPESKRPTNELSRAFADLRWRYARLVSAGPDGILSTPRDLFAGREAASTEKRGDDLVLFLCRPDHFEPEEEPAP